MGRDCFRRDRSPNGVAWRFPDWTAVGFRSRTNLSFRPNPRALSRTLFLGSSQAARPLPIASPALGPAQRLSEVSHLAVRCATGGDANPDCHWAFLRAHSLGWPRGLILEPATSCDVVAGRRLPPCPLLVASHGPCCHSEVGLSYWEPFPFSPFTFVPDDEGNDMDRKQNPQRFFDRGEELSTGAAQVLVWPKRRR